MSRSPSVARRREKAAAKSRRSWRDLAPVRLARRHRQDLLGQGLVRQPGALQRLRQPPAARAHLCPQRFGDRSPDPPGEVQAQVCGSSCIRWPSRVTAVPGRQWQAMSADCAGIDRFAGGAAAGEALQGGDGTVCTPKTGLFPAPKEIGSNCSCPDWASMCKHVAAVLYGVGARLDVQPELLFRLRRVDAKELVTQAGAGLPKSKHGPAAGKRARRCRAGRCVWYRDGRCSVSDETRCATSKLDGNREGGGHQENRCSSEDGQYESSR